VDVQEDHVDGVVPVRPGVEALLAAYASSSPPGESWAPQPSPGLMFRMVDEVRAVRRRGRRRRLCLVAAAATVAFGGSFVAGLGDLPGPGRPQSEQQQILALAERTRHTDPGTAVSAMIGTEQRAWGTEVGLELGNVRGPLTCQLVAVSRNGEEQTVATWAVPARGYGVPHTASQDELLYLQGGVGMSRKDIDRFEVRALDGRPLVTIKG
jgi:hypothetical protein